MSEHTASLALELKFDEEDEDEEPAEAPDEGSVHFDSSVSLPMSPKSDFVTPPLEFSGHCHSPSGKVMLECAENHTTFTSPLVMGLSRLCGNQQIQL